MKDHTPSTEEREELIASLRSLKYQETSRSGVMTIPLIAVLMADYHGQELLEVLADFILSDRQSTRAALLQELEAEAREYYDKYGEWNVECEKGKEAVAALVALIERKRSGSNGK